jgi:hypothetical protein
MAGLAARVCVLYVYVHVYVWKSVWKSVEVLRDVCWGLVGWRVCVYVCEHS